MPLHMISLSRIQFASDLKADGISSSTAHFSRIKITKGSGPELLSVTQFADEAKITPQAVRKMIAERRLNAEKIGEQYVISREKLTDYLLGR